jgi:hypothetical protein
MRTPKGLGFSHRFNADGTIDSICFECFKTVATSSQEDDLERCERGHTCPPDPVEHSRHEQTDSLT